MPGKVAKARFELPKVSSRRFVGATRRATRIKLLARDLDPGARRGFRGLWLGSLAFRGWECGSGRTRLGLGTGCGSGRCLGRCSGGFRVGQGLFDGGRGRGLRFVRRGLGDRRRGLGCGVLGGGVLSGRVGRGPGVDGGDGRRFRRWLHGWGVGDDSRPGNDRRGGRDRCDRGFRLRWLGCILGGFGLGRRVKRAFPVERIGRHDRKRRRRADREPSAAPGPVSAPPC